MLLACLCMRVCVYIHVVAKTNSCKNVVLRGCGSMPYFLTLFFKHAVLHLRSSDTFTRVLLRTKTHLGHSLIEMCCLLRSIW